MRGFTDNILRFKKRRAYPGGIFFTTTIAIVLALLLLSIMILLTPSSFLGKKEKIIETICSLLVTIAGINILIFRKKSPAPYARFIMFGLLMIIVMVLTLSETSFRPPLGLLITSALWALPLSLIWLYEGIYLWAVILLDLLLIGSFFSAIPVLHYSALLLLMFIPLSILTWERGWLGGIAGFIPLCWGLVDTRFTNYQDAGLFLLIWAPILGGASSALGLLVGDYKRIRKIISRLEICREMNREVLTKESFKEGIKTLLKYILNNIECDKYLLEIEGEGSESISLSSTPPPSLSDKNAKKKKQGIIQQKFTVADIRGEVILERDEEFRSDEKELLINMLDEVTPAIEKLLYLEKAVEMAISDPLTSLANRTYFFYWLNEDIHRANRYKTPLSLLLLDIDGFKTYNDLYGHRAGDAVLKKIGEKLKSMIRKSDIAARYGGDEFVILFPYANLEEAKKVSERIKQSISDMGLKISEGEYVTISGGLTMFREGEKPEEFLRRADMLLYKAKEKGGNRIEVG